MKTDYLRFLELKSEKQYLSFFGMLYLVEQLTNINVDAARDAFQATHEDEWERCDGCSQVGINYCNCCAMCDTDMADCNCDGDGEDWNEDGDEDR